MSHSTSLAFAPGAAEAAPGRAPGAAEWPASGAALFDVSVAALSEGRGRASPPARAPLVGIARLAAESPRELERNEVEYFRLPVRSLLNRVVSRRVGFEWSINPYRGCEFGCHYCYARYTHEYMELGAAEFEQKIYVKAGGAAALARDLDPAKLAGQHIAIGTATDPYQPAERRFGITRQVLETLLAWVGAAPGRSVFSVSITTKSDLVVRDTELLRALAAHIPVHVNLTVTTLNARLARWLEPRAPRPDLRLKAVRQLNDAGVSAGVFVAPVLPGITDKPEDLEAVVAAAAEARACYLGNAVLYLMPSAQKKFFPFLEEKFPRLAKRYRKWYTRHAYAPEDYRQRISALMRQLRARYGISGRWPGDDRLAAAPAAAPQLALPFAC